jgi:FkbM family methyltransferase
MKLKKLLKSLINQVGFDLQKLPKKETSNLPLEMEGETRLYKTPLGNFYLPVNAPDDIVINLIKDGKVFEPEVVEVAKRFIKKGSVVLDVGANFGQMAVLFSKMTGENGIVYAFEADDFVFEILKENIKANNCKNIIPVFGAVYNQSDKNFFFPKQDFKRFAAYGSYGIDPNAVSGRKVNSLKIDDFDFAKSVSFMKVDVQGSDLFAMQGAKLTIEKHKMPIIFEFEQQFQDEFGTSFQDYVDFVSSIDYKFTETLLAVNYLINPK